MRLGRGECGRGRVEELHWGGLVYDLFGGSEVERERRVGRGEVGDLVLDDDVAAVAGEVEQGLCGSAVKIGVRVIGADAEDDRVELSQTRRREIGERKFRDGKSDGREGLGDGIAGSGKVSDAAMCGEVQVDGDDAVAGGLEVVRPGKTAIAYPFEAFGDGAVLR